MRLLIVNGGASPHKLTAIEVAKTHFSALRSARVVSAPAKSLVREQPEILRRHPSGGWDEEAFKGAVNRALGAKEASPDGDIFVGIENAVQDIGFIVDIPLVVVLVGEHEYFGTGSGLAFSRGDYLEALSRGFDTTTVGQVVSERMKGVDPTNPSKALAGVDRVDSIVAGLVMAFGAMIIGCKARGVEL